MSSKNEPRHTRVRVSPTCLTTTASGALLQTRAPSATLFKGEARSRPSPTGVERVSLTRATDTSAHIRPSVMGRRIFQPWSEPLEVDECGLET